MFLLILRVPRKVVIAAAAAAVGPLRLMQTSAEYVIRLLSELFGFIGGRETWEDCIG